MQFVLDEMPDLDIDGRIDRPGSEMLGYGMKPAPDQYFNALEAAAWRGDVEMGKLLVRHGARPDAAEPLSKLSLAELARSRGHGQFAEWAENQLQGGTQ